MKGDDYMAAAVCSALAKTSLCMPHSSDIFQTQKYATRLLQDCLQWLLSSMLEIKVSRAGPGSGVNMGKAWLQHIATMM